jgi:Asp-tRNA(Asn)/Glu-tRNA(Gln) amidotransferase A subunit family amidase
LQTLPADKRASVLPYIQAWADSAQSLSGRQVYEATSQFHNTRIATTRATNPYDYVISPTSPVVAFDAELPSPTNDPLRPLEHIAFTVPFNMSEQPAASINCGYTQEGLPIGLQISGRRFDDLGVLQLCRAFELLRDAQRSWPQAHH